MWRQQQKGSRSHLSKPPTHRPRIFSRRASASAIVCAHGQSRQPMRSFKQPAARAKPQTRSGARIDEGSCGQHLQPVAAEGRRADRAVAKERVLITPAHSMWTLEKLGKHWICGCFYEEALDPAVQSLISRVGQSVEAAGVDLHDLRDDLAVDARCLCNWQPQQKAAQATVIAGSACDSQLQTHVRNLLDLI